VIKILTGNGRVRYGTVWNGHGRRINSDPLLYSHGTVRPFDYFSGKKDYFRQKIHYASPIETTSVKKNETENEKYPFENLRVRKINTKRII
jgi:hypothetical protein